MIYYLEDDTNVRELTIYALKQAGLDAVGFSAADEFFAATNKQLPTLVLLDIMLPGTDGLEVLRRLRKGSKTKNLPIMMLTAKSTEFDKVTGLDCGADDYLAKPFGMMELISRVNALLRRAGTTAENAAESQITFENITLNVSEHSVSASGVVVDLTLKEFDLLHVLMKHPGRVFSRDQLLESAWGMSYAGETRTVDVHVQTLRQKLASAYKGSEKLIKTVRGVGYCIKVPKNK